MAAKRQLKKNTSFKLFIIDRVFQTLDPARSRKLRFFYGCKESELWRLVRLLALIRVYDDAGNVIETHEHAGEFKEW